MGCVILRPLWRAIPPELMAGVFARLPNHTSFNERTTMEKNELIKTGREWIEHSPPATNGPDGLSGFADPIKVCQSCSSRIIRRGCNLKLLASTPVWDTDDFPCDLCQST